MKRLLGFLSLVFSAVPLAAAEKDERVYRLYCYKGNVEANHEYIRDVVMKHNERLGIETIGVFIPEGESDNFRILVLTAYKNEEEYKKWEQNSGDYNDEERKAKEAVEAKYKKAATGYGNGVNLSATDFSPSQFKKADGVRVFELRTYIATKGNLEALHSRFRDHTVKLFEKHGMTNLAYFKVHGEMDDFNKTNLATTLSPSKGRPNHIGIEMHENDTLIYLLAHKNQETAKKSFEAFQKDPDWVKAKEVSEAKAGGSLTVKNGVISLFLKPTDYSPLK